MMIAAVCMVILTVSFAALLCRAMGRVREQMEHLPY